MNKNKNKNKNNKNKERKKILLIFLALISFAFAILSPMDPALAASTYDAWQKYTGKDGKLTKETLDSHTFNDTVFSALEATGGRVNLETGEEERSGAIQFTTKMIAALYSAPPASGIYYAYNILHRIGAVPAYAQGTGFTGLQPIIRIWKAFRDVVYVLFTIIFIGIGIAIILRIKISPQAVITIENALPRLISALILVTFSYAIAGFMIDLMYVLMALTIVTLKPLIPGNLAGHLGDIKSLVNYGFFSLVPPFTTMIGKGTLLFSFIGGLLGALGGAVVGGVVGSAIPIPIVGNIIGGIVGAAVGIPIGVAVVILIFCVIALFAFIKLFISLVKGYIKIILSIILSPFQIAMGALPIGIKGFGFGAWLKGIITELLVFVAVLAVALLGIIIGSSALENN